MPHEVIITFTNHCQIGLLKTIFLKVISNFSQCEQRLYLEIEEEEEENVGYLFFFCFSTLYLFAAGGTLMMPFQNGHIIFKKPLVNNFRVAYVDTNCYSPHLPSPQECTVHTVCWNRVLRGHFLGIKMQHWNKCLTSPFIRFLLVFEVPYRPRVRHPAWKTWIHNYLWLMTWWVKHHTEIAS